MTKKANGYDWNRVTKIAESTPKGINTNHRKEDHFYKEWALVGLNDKREIHKFIDIRFYGSGSVVYCCVWVHDGREDKGMPYLSGSAKAGGYGYHKESAAMEAALNDAGFTFAAHFGGCGDSAMRVALEAIARKAKIRKATIMVAHG